MSVKTTGYTINITVFVPLHFQPYDTMHWQNIATPKKVT